jgi:predicted ATPase/class 3 adenylate cyclase
MRTELPSGTVTFLFTDIEGSTRLLHALGPDAYGEALAQHRRVLRAAFAAHDGVEVDTQGDAFFVAFPTVPGAVAAAAAGQQALEPGRIRVRMGLHTGTPTLTSEGYVGVDVHRGARVAALAHGGQVLVTEATATLVDGVALTDLGRHRLKDFDGPAQLFQLGRERHPPLRTPGTVLLPTPATRFLGRERELYDAVSLVLTEAPPILTVIGPGGTGKTRFSIEVARLLAEDAEGGTVFVPLAALRDPALVLPAIADAVGADDASPEGIAARIGERRTHLLLDNVEQLLPAVAATLASLVARASSLRLLVTSREALNVAAETRFDLPPLVLEEAVTFFVERAKRVNAAIEPTQDVTTLCERLDRLPLALELAAARTRLLQPQSILERLEDRLDLPAQRDADPRHATLRATIAWSYDLLSPGERNLFATLAIFHGGCTLEAAEEVCGADLDTLASLIDKSLVRRRAGASGSDRYWMLETIREFAAARLDELPDETRATLHLGHARRMLVVARSAGLQGELEPTVPRPEILRPEIDDVRAALDWAIDAEPILAAELIMALEMHWVTQAIEEGLAGTRALLALGDVLSPRLRADLLTVDGGLKILTESDQAAGEPSYYAAIDLYRELEDARGEARLLSRLAVHAGTRGEREQARDLLDRARQLTDGLDVPALEAQRLGALAMLADADGELESALALYADAAEVAGACGFTLWETWSRTDLAEVALRLERFDVAESEARTALAKAWEHGDRRIACWCLIVLAGAALARGKNVRAGRLWGATSAEIEETGVLMGNDDLQRLTEALRDADDPDFEEGVDLGRASSLENAVALGLDAGDRGDGSAPIQTEP